MTRHLKRKPFKLLHNALGLMDAKIADVGCSTRENSAVRMHGCNEAKFGCPVSLYSQEAL